MVTVMMMMMMMITRKGGRKKVTFYHIAVIDFILMGKVMEVKGKLISTHLPT